MPRGERASTTRRPSAASVTASSSTFATFADRVDDVVPNVQRARQFGPGEFRLDDERPQFIVLPHRVECFFSGHAEHPHATNTRQRSRIG